MSSITVGTGISDRPCTCDALACTFHSLSVLHVWHFDNVSKNVLVSRKTS